VRRDAVAVEHRYGRITGLKAQAPAPSPP
jgi:hypothetical protein